MKIKIADPHADIVRFFIVFFFFYFRERSRQKKLVGR
jgi:hypothetical protein